MERALGAARSQVEQRVVQHQQRTGTGGSQPAALRYREMLVNWEEHDMELEGIKAADEGKSLFTNTDLEMAALLPVCSVNVSQGQQGHGGPELLGRESQSRGVSKERLSPARAADKHQAGAIRSPKCLGLLVAVGFRVP